MNEGGTSNGSVYSEPVDQDGQDDQSSQYATLEEGITDLLGSCQDTQLVYPVEDAVLRVTYYKSSQGSPPEHPNCDSSVNYNHFARPEVDTDQYNSPAALTTNIVYDSGTYDINGQTVHTSLNNDTGDHYLLIEPGNIELRIPGCARFERERLKFLKMVKGTKADYSWKKIVRDRYLALGVHSETAKSRKKTIQRTLLDYRDAHIKPKQLSRTEG
nr:hypothetical protein L204_06084 [Cryptococcus depauperatus CBS 7855]